MPRLVNLRPSRQAAFFLAAIPFVLIAILYLGASSARLTANPDDKLLPPPGNFVTAMRGMALEEDKRTGRVLFWDDTVASLSRLAWGVAAATVVALVLGVAIGLVPHVGATMTPVIAVISMVPPLAILPILFIVLGLGEVSKVVLIAVGVAPFLIRDLAMRVQAIPSELLIKAQTLGASTWHLAIRVALPLVLPRLIEGVRLSLGPAWLFLIAAEAIAATEGLGYRIFLVRRFLAMDVILPYVAWITLLAFIMDRLLALLGRRLFPWAEQS